MRITNVKSRSVPILSLPGESERAKRQSTAKIIKENGNIKRKKNEIKMSFGVRFEGCFDNQTRRAQSTAMDNTVWMANANRNEIISMASKFGYLTTIYWPRGHVPVCTPAPLIPHKYCNEYVGTHLSISVRANISNYSDYHFVNLARSWDIFSIYKYTCHISHVSCVANAQISSTEVVPVM